MNNVKTIQNQRLEELMYNAQNQQKQNRVAGANTLYGRQEVENIYKPATKGAVQGFVEGFGEGAGKATGAAIAG